MRDVNSKNRHYRMEEVFYSLLQYRKVKNYQTLLDWFGSTVTQF